MLDKKDSGNESSKPVIWWGGASTIHSGSGSMIWRANHGRALEPRSLEGGGGRRDVSDDVLLLFFMLVVLVVVEVGGRLAAVRIWAALCE